jgi:hypothetical protein
MKICQKRPNALVRFFRNLLQGYEGTPVFGKPAPVSPKPFNHLEILGFDKLKPFVPNALETELESLERPCLGLTKCAIKPRTVANICGHCYGVVPEPDMNPVSVAIRNAVRAERERCLAVLRDELELTPQEDSELVRRIVSGEPFTPLNS